MFFDINHLLKSTYMYDVVLRKLRNMFTCNSVVPDVSNFKQGNERIHIDLGNKDFVCQDSKISCFPQACFHIKSFTSRAKEISKGRRPKNDAWPPGCHGRWLRDFLKLFLLDMSFTWHPCLIIDNATFSWPGLHLCTIQDLHVYFPALLCTTNLAQGTSQYYFILQTLRKLLPGTTSYYKSCAKCFPALLRTTKLAKSTSQHYFGLHSLLAQGASRIFPVLLYYFLLQNSLHKVLPRTTSCHRACTKYFTSSTGDSCDAWVRFQILCPGSPQGHQENQEEGRPAELQMGLHALGTEVMEVPFGISSQPESPTKISEMTWKKPFGAMPRDLLEMPHQRWPMWNKQGSPPDALCEKKVRASIPTSIPLRKQFHCDLQTKP